MKLLKYSLNQFQSLKSSLDELFDRCGQSRFRHSSNHSILLLSTFEDHYSWDAANPVLISYFRVFIRVELIAFQLAFINLC